MLMPVLFGILGGITRQSAIPAPARLPTWQAP